MAPDLLRGLFAVIRAVIDYHGKGRNTSRDGGEVSRMRPAAAGTAHRVAADLCGGVQDLQKVQGHSKFATMWTATLILWLGIAAVQVVWIVLIVKDAKEETNDVVKLGGPKNQGGCSRKQHGAPTGLAHNSNKSELGDE